jgi:hypothetical protein
MGESPDLSARVAKLEDRVEELLMIQNLLLRLASTTRPLATLLQQYGATETQEQALYRLLDRVRDGVKGSERDRMSFAIFRRGFSEIFPVHRDDREFIQLLIDTLKVERPAYRELHTYMTAHRWPVWD